MSAAAVHRSLVLGSVDRPALHDIVLDYVISQHTSDELRTSHRKLVDLLRAERPLDAVSRQLEWNNVGNTPTSRYVRDYCLQHMQLGWNSDRQSDEHAIKYWLLEAPQDDIVKSAGSFLGFEMLSRLVRKFEETGSATAAEKFDVAKLAASAGRCAKQEGLDSSVMLEMQRKAMDILGELAEVAKEGDGVHDDQDRLELEVLVQILVASDPADFRFMPRKFLALVFITRCMSSSMLMVLEEKPIAVNICWCVLRPGISGEDPCCRSSSSHD
eukprot:COSAG02_NODE_5854_length_3987_cov_169.941872_2_plen_271_part_00